jgi:long-chain acyl-CoA synthetase
LRSRYISQCIFYGDNKEYNVILIIPDYDELKCWAEKTHNWNYTDDETLLNTSFVTNLINSEIEQACLLMRGFEKPRKWCGLIEPFSTDNQLLTPKLSLRRKLILQEYSDIVKALYENDDFGVCINS